MRIIVSRNKQTNKQNIFWERKFKGLMHMLCMQKAQVGFPEQPGPWSTTKEQPPNTMPRVASITSRYSFTSLSYQKRDLELEVRLIVQNKP